MWHDIINFKKLGGYCLELEFDNGRKGVVDLASYAARGGVFSRFADKSYFDAVTLIETLACSPGPMAWISRRKPSTNRLWWQNVPSHTNPRGKFIGSRGHV